MIKVFSHPHTKFAACILVNSLNELGTKAILVDKISPNDKDLHIIYNASAVKHLPTNYIVYQTEVPGSSWFNSRYHQIIKKAVAVWDYSMNNTQAYQHSKTFIVPPGIAPQPKAEKTIDVLFYGWLNGSKHRQQVINEMRRHVNVVAVDNALEEEIWGLLNRSKVVVNIHYYANAPLEVFRINEALSFNCHVVSERSVAGDNDYFNVVEFRKPESMGKACKELLHKPFNHCLKYYSNRGAIYRALDSF